MTDKPRELTDKEVRSRFLARVHANVDHWANVSNKTEREKLSGLAFSIMVILDGGAGLPRFVVAPAPRPDEKRIHQEHGENWFPEFNASSPCDIAGSLHEVYHEATTNDTVR
jgi:hypothetical protein